VQVLKNPMVFMVIVGILGHFALGQRIPAVLSQFIDGLANSFGGAALFYLGLTMVALVLVLLYRPVFYIYIYIIYIYYMYIYLYIYLCIYIH